MTSTALLTAPKKSTESLVDIQALERHQTRPRRQALEQQYGGSHAGAWVDQLPRSWIPFIQLARLSPPVGMLMAFFPHLLGIILGAIATRAPIGKVINAGFTLLLYSFFGSNTGHALNDLVDQPFDRLVARTRMRPIARGAVTPHAALLFAAVNLTGLLLVICMCLPPGTVRYVLPNIAAVVYYPLAKRHTHFAQLVLGFCLSWTIFIGSLSVGHEPFSWWLFESSLRNGRHQIAIQYPQVQSARIDVGIVSLFLGMVFWTVISDTVYAHQDIKDDLQLKLRSMAILCGERTKPILGIFLAVMTVCLGFCGFYYSFSPSYYVLGLGGSFSILAAMILRVNLKDPSNCWWWFCRGFWCVYLCLVGSLFLEYLLK